MKELKYNVRVLLQRKELYFAIIGILLINLLHVYFAVREMFYYEVAAEVTKTAEYKFILYNTLTQATTILVIIILPLLCSMILCDTSWLDSHRKTNNMLYSRLNLKKLIFTRWFLSILVTFIIVFVSFMLEYGVLITIFGSGNKMTFFHGIAYDAVVYEDFFLDTIRAENPVKFIVLISAHVSLILGLLSAISYTASFYIKQRVIIYFQIILFMLIVEIILNIFQLSKFSIIGQLQPFSRFGVLHAVSLYIVLFLLSFIPLLLQVRKKDVL